MEMVNTKEYAIGNPIPLSKNTGHFGEKQPAKDKFLAKKGVEYRHNREQN